jgi:hypothetical protein
MRGEGRVGDRDGLPGLPIGKDCPSGHTSVNEGVGSMDYPAIEDHGLIGELQTAALVSTDGTVDWMCLPRFDSPSVFASLVPLQNSP